jgi:hypothetical protein
MLKQRLVRRYDFVRRYDDKRWLLLRYRTIYGKDLDLANPQTFTEKLFYRMIMVSRYGNPNFTRLTDKFFVRDYVRQKIGDNYLVDLLWSGVNPNEIPFDNLPPKCVVKTNNGSGRNIFLQDPIDRQSVVETLFWWLKENYYWQSREYHYYKIKPRIIIEPFLDDGHPDWPLDYRCWCFGGHPEIIQIDNHDHSSQAFYDVDWKKLQLKYRDYAECDLQKPANLMELVLVASKLSSEFDFVRVDLYNLNGRIKFGEFSFTPRAGNYKFEPNAWDMVLGRKWVMR